VSENVKRALLITIKERCRSGRTALPQQDARQAKRDREREKGGWTGGGESGRYLSSHCWDAPYNNETKRKIQDASGAVLALQLSAYIQPMGNAF
jgi:hypothetical protein